MFKDLTPAEIFEVQGLKEENPVLIRLATGERNDHFFILLTNGDATTMLNNTISLMCDIVGAVLSDTQSLVLEYRYALDDHNAVVPDELWEDSMKKDASRVATMGFWVTISDRQKA